MSNKNLKRKVARAQAATKPEPQPYALIAGIRKSRTGHIGVIEIHGKDEVIATCSGATVSEVMSKVYDLMESEFEHVSITRVILEGTN